MRKRIRELWKQFLFWIGAAMVCIVFCAMLGCAQAESEKAVHALDWQESMHMLQTAALEQTDSRSIREHLSVPARVRMDLSSEDGFIHIAVDAPVIAAQVSSAPVVRVKPRAFSQAEVSRIFELLCRDAVLYSRAEADMSKPEIESEIAFVQKCIADEHNADHPALLAHWKGYIRQLETQYEAAPDTPEQKRVPNGIMTVQQDMDYGTMEPYGSHEAVVSDNGDLYFTAMNNMDQHVPGVVDYGADGEIISAYGARTGARIGFGAISRYPKGYTSMYDSRYLLLEDETVVPKEAQGELSVTPRDARLAAEALLKDTGMEVQEIHIVRCAPSGSGEDAPAEYGYLYGVFSARSVNGVLCNVMDEEAPAPWKYKGGGGAYKPQWSYERCLLLYGDKGVVHFEWEAPMEICEILTSRAQLLPFADILDVFTHMAPIVMEDYTGFRDGIERYEIEVDRIQFGLHRIAEAADMEEGMLVPVWSFYGSQTIYGSNGSVGAANAYMMPEIILSINAINGNIIQSDKGY